MKNYDRAVALEGVYVSTEDYAKKTGLSVATIKRRCKAGDLKAVKVGRSWLIQVEEG